MNVKYIKWIDSAATQGWHFKGDANYGPIKCESIGMVIEDCESHITIAQTIGENDSRTEVMSTPKGCIIEIIDVDFNPHNTQYGLTSVHRGHIFSE